MLLVLPVFLFLPETWGIASHLAQRESGSLAGYKVAIPATWVILFHHKSSDGYSGISGIAGRGLGLGVNPLRYDSLSAWYVGTRSPDQKRSIDYRVEHSDIVHRAELTVGGEAMTCLDYWPTYLYGPKSSENARIVHVSCSSSGRLGAGFDGMRSQVPDFYEMLATVRPAP
jgi:hypothetical protein